MEPPISDGPSTPLDVNPPRVRFRRPTEKQRRRLKYARERNKDITILSEHERLTAELETKKEVPRDWMCRAFAGKCARAVCGGRVQLRGPPEGGRRGMDTRASARFVFSPIARPSRPPFLPSPARNWLAWSAL